MTAKRARQTRGVDAKRGGPCCNNGNRGARLVLTTNYLLALPVRRFGHVG